MVDVGVILIARTNVSKIRVKIINSLPDHFTFNGKSYDRVNIKFGPMDCVVFKESVLTHFDAWQQLLKSVMTENET